MKKDIIILGSTGSIGISTLKVIKKYNKKFKIKLLTTNNNVKKIYYQAVKFNVQKVVIKNKKKFETYKNLFKKKKIKCYFDIDEALNSLNKKVYYTINAIAGIEGLEPALSSIKHTENIAIANKESIICGWKLIINQLKKNKTNFIPIDSEHFTIWSLLKSENIKNIKKIYLTASGGPFLKKNLYKIKNINPTFALKHPKWNMGKKISIDSATMMNKVFEIIEAKKIFNLNYNKFNIIIHPDSYVHSLIHFNTGLIKFVAHDTSMEIPIINSLHTNHEEFFYKSKNIDFKKLNKLNFSTPNIKQFPLIKILEMIPNKESYFEIVLVSLNDELVMRYLNRKINYISIHILLFKLIKDPYFAKFYNKNPSNINDIKNMVKKVKIFLKNFLKKNENKTSKL